MKKNIIKVIFKDGGREEYAASIPAVFEKYTSEELGCTLGTAKLKIWENSGFYETEKVKFIRMTSASVLEEHLPDSALSAML